MSRYNAEPESVLESLRHQLSEPRSDGLHYLKSKDIATYLQIAEIQLDIVFDRSNIWDITNSFIEKYPKLLINSDLLVNFLDDLYELDFVRLVNDTVKTKKADQLVNDTVLDDVFKSDVFNSTPIKEESSPVNEEINIKEEKEEHVKNNVNSIKLESDDTLQFLQKRIDQRIEEFSQPSDFKKPITTTVSTAIETDNNESVPSIIEKKQIQTPKSNSTKNPSLLSVAFLLVLIINVSLLFVLIFVLSLVISSTLRTKVVEFLLNTQSSDIYWWQKIPLLEKYTWEILELIRSDDLK